MSQATPVGERLKELRLERGLSLRDVAAKTGVSDSLLSKMETGRTTKPTQESLNRLALFYEIDPEELWTLAEYKIASSLPSFTPYLRSRYDLPPEAIDEMRNHFDYIQAKYEGRQHTNGSNRTSKD